MSTSLWNYYTHHPTTPTPPQNPSGAAADALASLSQQPGAAEQGVMASVIDMPMVPSSLLHQVSEIIVVILSVCCASRNARYNLRSPTHPNQHTPKQTQRPQSFLLASLSHALLPHLALLGASDSIAVHPLALIGLCGAIASAFTALPVGPSPLCLSLAFDRPAIQDKNEIKSDGCRRLKN